MATDSSDHEKKDWISNSISCAVKKMALCILKTAWCRIYTVVTIAVAECCISVTESATRSALRLTRGEEVYIILTLGWHHLMSQILPTTSAHKTTPKGTHVHGEPFPSLNAVTCHRHVEPKETWALLSFSFLLLQHPSKQTWLLFQSWHIPVLLMSRCPLLLSSVFDPFCYTYLSLNRQRIWKSSKSGDNHKSCSLRQAWIR